MNVWLIYLVSLTQPRIAVIAEIKNDSILYYHHGYFRKKIIHEVSNKIYLFDNGYMNVNKRFVRLEFFNGEKVKYRIKKKKYD